MPKYLVQASYVGDGVQGLRKEGGSARRAAVEKACVSVGGTLESFYFAFGETDVVAIIDVPDNITAAG
ncbi:MAG: GYD domain-containing protein, partial [Acidimicrobiales bacterium]